MRLATQSGDRWQYLLNRHEADILRGLLKTFPFTELARAEASKNDHDQSARERAELLTASLTEHRDELRQLAANLLGAEHWRVSENGHLLTLDSAAREILLQILNDIRIGSWRVLGEPEVLEEHRPATTREFTHRQLMDLAGYFEMGLLEPEEGAG
jgi:hypothetical protein